MSSEVRGHWREALPIFWQAPDKNDALKEFVAGFGPEVSVVTLSFFGRSLHIVKEVETAKAAIDAINRQVLIKPPSAAKVSLVGGQSIFLSGPELWQRQREATATLLSNVPPETPAIIARETQALLERWKKQAETQDIQDVESGIRALVLQIGCESLFRSPLSRERNSELAKAISAITHNPAKYIGVNLLGLPQKLQAQFFPSVSGPIDTLRNYAEDLCAAKTASSDDVGAQILCRRSLISSTVESEKNQAIEEIAMLLTAAGTPTAPICHAISLLAADKTLKQTIQKELRETPPNKDGSPRSEALNKLIFDALKGKPPLAINIPRVAQSSFDLSGVTIKKRDVVFIALEFMPDDFRGKFFSAGKNACPGKNYAMQLMTGILAQFAQCDWDFKLAKDFGYFGFATRSATGGVFEKTDVRECRRAET